MPLRINTKNVGVIKNIRENYYGVIYLNDKGPCPQIISNNKFEFKLEKIRNNNYMIISNPSTYVKKKYYIGSMLSRTNTDTKK
jgi:hypothetical protein